MFEEFTEEYFLNQAKSFGDELGVDTRTGSVYMDMAAGHCIRAAFFFANLRELFNMFSLDTCYADILDDKAEEWSLARHPATKAVFNITYEGTAPEAGDRFFAEDSEYYFTVIVDEDTSTLRLEAETEGTAVNTLSAGTEIIPVDDIDGLEAAYLGEIYTLGSDEEDDDSLRTRLREKMAGPAENGNRQHYKTWCESIDGVGRARIIPLFAGENTVRAVLYSPEGLPCSADVVKAVQDYIDPITQNYEFTDDSGKKWVCGDGFGDGVANIGAHFLATAAEELSLSVTFNATPKEGYNIESCEVAAREVIESYLQELSLETEEGETVIIRISAIGAMIAELPQVLDYENLKLNGGTVNITVPDGYAAVLEEVDADAGS